MLNTKYMLWIHVNLYYKLNQESLFHPQGPGSICKGHVVVVTDFQVLDMTPPHWGALRIWRVQVEKPYLDLEQEAQV